MVVWIPLHYRLSWMIQRCSEHKEKETDCPSGRISWQQPILLSLASGSLFEDSVHETVDLYPCVAHSREAIELMDVDVILRKICSSSFVVFEAVSFVSSVSSSSQCTAPSLGTLASWRQGHCLTRLYFPKIDAALPRCLQHFQCQTA